MRPAICSTSLTVQMRMDVDESRRYHKTVCIQGLSTWPQMPTHRRDFSVRDRNVGHIRRCAGAIDHRAIANH
jgi:hypothetical protein